MPDTELDLNTKYLRVGHIDQGRICDTLCKAAVTLLPGDLMPQRWAMKTPEIFCAKYGADPKWAKTQNYHLYIYEGKPLFRIWTHASGAKSYVWIDVDSIIAKELADYWPVQAIPPGIFKKCRPFTQRICASDTNAIILITTLARSIYGIGSL